MQFAGQRTDMNLNPIGEEVNILVKLPDDTLPSPGAIAVTKITPQKTQEDGITEAELCRYLTDEIFIPNTCILGFNSVRFDDEFMRHLFWRNFYDPYEWQWRDGRSRWDMLDVVRLTRALRPEGINWPTGEKEIDGKKVAVKTNRLELITKLNNIEHKHAHDALSDVYATIAVAKLIKEKQPDLFNYLFKMRNKKLVQKLVNLENPAPFVYASGRYSSEFDKTTVAFPLAPSRKGNVLVWDLRYDIEECVAEQVGDPRRAVRVMRAGPPGAELGVGAPSDDSWGSTQQDPNTPATAPWDAEGRRPTSQLANKPQKLYPKLKELCYNKCPAVAPLGVLDKDDGWQKIGLSKDQIEKNLKSLLSHPDFVEKAREEDENHLDFPPAIDPESALYDGFLDDRDRNLCGLVRAASKNQLADLHPEFSDPRLDPLLLHYKAKNFPDTLSEDEQKEWEKYRLARLNRQSVVFNQGIEELSKRSDIDQFLIDELLLWAQSLATSY